MNNYGYDCMKEKNKLTRNELFHYWKNPVKKSEGEDNTPKHYIEGKERSEVLITLIKKYLSYNARILEIGCNVGRNLNFLYETGYIDLSGIEINKKAIDLMEIVYTDMYKNSIIINSTVEEAIIKLPDEYYDLVFTMAVLEHIHFDSVFIFSDMMRISRKYIITIEDEVTGWSERHFPRNYKNIFNRGKWGQIYEINCQELNILDDRFWIRIFCKDV